MTTSRYQLPSGIQPLARVTLVGALAEAPVVHYSTATKRAVVDVMVQAGDTDIPITANGDMAEKFRTMLPGTVIRAVADLTVYNWQTAEDKHRQIARVVIEDCEVLAPPVDKPQIAAMEMV